MTKGAADRPSGMRELSEFYRVLEVDPGASLDEIRESWRDLVQVWHPDRFRDNPRLHQKAEERIKRINTAYETIKNGGPLEGARASSSPEEGFEPSSHGRRTAEPDFWEALEEGVQSWNLFRKKWSDIRPSLSGRDLRGRAFEGIDFRECNLAAADLSGADLYKANLSHARANGLRLTEADLNRAIALEAELEGADLGRANLASADLRGAHLRRANLEGATMTGARIEGTDLSGARGLTYDQIELAEIDVRTKLPSSLY